MADQETRREPGDTETAAAAKLLQRLADDLRRSPGSAANTEYTAILNWLGEFDVMEEFAERALEYRMRSVSPNFRKTVTPTCAR